MDMGVAVALAAAAGLWNEEMITAKRGNVKDVQTCLRARAFSGENGAGGEEGGVFQIPVRYVTICPFITKRHG